MGKRIVLSLDGGGVRGLLSASVLAHIEHTLKSRHRLSVRGLAHNFDMIVGTSSGALLGLGLASGKTATEMVDIYRKNAGRIFSASWIGKRFNPIFGNKGATYKPHGLEQVLKDLLGDKTLGQLGADGSDGSEQSRPLLMFTAYDTEQATNRYFKSWKAGHDELPAWQVARASSAAPTYFPPMSLYVPKMSRDDPEPDATLIDGGLFANNPAMSAWAEARKLEWPENELMILSVGSGERQEKYGADDKPFRNKLSLIKPTFDAMFDGQSDAVDYQLSKLYDVADATVVRYLRLQTDLAHASDALDNAETRNLDALLKDAQALIADQTDKIDAFIEGAWS